MACTRPNLAWWYKDSVPAAERDIIATPRFVSKYMDAANEDLVWRWSGLPDWSRSMFELILLPCGHCDACLMSRAREWTARVLCEARYHTKGCFLTLTCDDEHIDHCFPGGGLSYYPFQCFLKRLRKEISPIAVRFVMCGEYGEHYRRPHYHCLLFGYDFPDRLLWSFNNGNPLYRSPMLEKLWKFGFSTIGSISQQSIQYVCRYVLKKSFSVSSERGELPREFIRMSTVPGIGYKFFQEFGLTDIYKFGSDGKFYGDILNVGSLTIRPPRYFDKKFSEVHNVDFVSLSRQRKDALPSLWSLRDCDFREAEEFYKAISKGRIKKGLTNV